MKKFFLLGIMVCLAMVASAQRSMEWYTYWGSNVAGNQIEPQRMAIDNDGNIYVAALFGGNKVSVEGTQLTSNSAADKGDAVIVKMTPSKTVLWTYAVAAAGNATVADLAIDQQGNVIVTGAFNRSIRLGEGTMALDDSNMGEAAIYVLKLASDGAAVNAWQIPAVGAKAGAVEVDSQDNIIVAGILDGDATFVPGGDPEGDFSNTAQLFVAKYTNAGVLVWHEFRNDEGQSVYSKPSLAVDANDNIYVGSAITGQTTINGTPVSATASNAFILAYDAAGTERWYHVIDGDESDETADVAVSPIGQVVLAVNHHSGDLRIDDMSDVFNNGYAFDAAYTHSAFFAFDLAGEFKWFYDWGYSNNADGSDAVCYAVRCSDEGVWYVAGMMTGRYGGSRLPEEIRTLPAGRNSGVETIDHQWLQHNTNGGQDCYLLTLTRNGELANSIRPGGPQYEYGMDVALSPDKKSIYFLQAINVRDKAPFTCPDNIFDSWTDLDGKGRKSMYNVLTVFCPEYGENPYTKAYKGVFASSLLVKYSLPQIDPEQLPYFEVGVPYSQALGIAAAQGQVSLYPLAKYADVNFDGTTVSGTFENDNDRYVGVLAVDSIALPGEITYYSYDADTHYSLRSNPRTVRYMPLTIDKSEGIEAVEGGKNNTQGRKLVRDGVLYIERNGRLYNAQGAQVK